jgi:REP element-mobilizing transposase RayT
LPLLGTAPSRDRFLSILEQTRQRYRLVVIGYVVMPEHIHLLITEPKVGAPSTVMQVLKQRTARALLPKRKRRNPRQRSLFGDAPQRRAFWQARFYDFNVWTTKKRVEKLRYMHRNPVKRGLVESPNNGDGAATASIFSTSPGRCTSMRAGPKFHSGLDQRSFAAVGIRVTRLFGKLRASSRKKREDGAPTFFGNAQRDQRSRPPTPVHPCAVLSGASESRFLTGHSAQFGMTSLLVRG